jgi:hypothetical protein
MLERTLRGGLASDDAGALAERLIDLERSGIPRGQAEEALRRHRAGDNEGLKEMLERLAQIERALSEHEELRNAREQVRRAQESLGERRSRARAGHGPWTDADEDEDKDRVRDDRTNTGADKRPQRPSASGASRSGATLGDSAGASDGERPPSLPHSGDSPPTLKPQSRLREGEEFAAQGKALPRSGRPNVENVQMSSEFAPQVEEVLSKEQYPAHYKEFIRRYFLNLSQGAHALQQQPPGTR